MGVMVSAITSEQLERAISGHIKAGTKCVVSNVNIYAMNLAYRNPAFREHLNRSDYVFCDGFGVKWGAEYLGYELGERFTPPDWLPEWSKRHKGEAIRLFLLGSQENIAEKAADVINREYSGFTVVGSHHGYFDRSSGSKEQQKVIDQINDSKANVVLVGFGMPIQEEWIFDNLDALSVNALLPVGSALDYIAREVYRAPKWVCDIGLEWFVRLLVEPRRLWRRYLIGNVRFYLRLFRLRVCGG